jgi:UDP-N-acetyl-D-glucosamine dehydrogenase
MTETRQLVVIGHGYLGLPLAMRGFEVGFDVVGFDIDRARVKSLHDGESFAEDSE